MDEQDKTIEPNILRYFVKEHPVIFLIFKEYEESIANNSKELVGYILDLDRFNKAGLLDKYIIGNKDMEIEYLRALPYKKIYILQI